MKKVFVLVCALSFMLLAETGVRADGFNSINGRIGVTGRIGFSLSADSVINNSGFKTDTAFIGGGGFIYGITDCFATELDITHASYSTNSSLFNSAPLSKGDFSTTNISLGVQCRLIDFDDPSELVPYVGVGLDILINDASAGGISGVDTVAGLHLSGGVDYFILKELAITSELKGVLAPNADIHNHGGAKIGSFDPDTISMTFGLRYFFN